jgi:hypothetical protein
MLEVAYYRVVCNGKRLETAQELVAHTCNPSYLGGRDQEDRGSRPAWAKSETPSQKQPMQRRAGKMDEVVEYLPSKHEVLSSNSSINKTNPRNKKHPEKLEARQIIH